MTALLDAITRRELVVGLAILGAVLALAGSSRRRTRNETQRTAMGSRLVKAGYVLTGISILLFIIAGFRS